ncbi:MAG: DUF362 domain-containing protein [Candidatus Nealsonbacteria bacterium]|nr:DUF362 domain-containing protein [Candidatus Nealsonbacteria bacterium]
MNDTTLIEFVSYDESVPEVLDAIGAAEVLGRQTAVLIKPNLVNDSPFPITTPPECVEAVIRYVRSCSQAEIVIGEGCGEMTLETPDIFDRLGYTELARRHGIELVDLNHAPLVKLQNADCPVFKEMYLPEIAMSHFLISVPVLKAHSLAEMTGTLKNLIGLVPPKHYSGRHGSWKKAVFHGRMHQSIIDLNRYRTPDLSLVDATVGMAEFHLGGAHCDPPLNKLIAGFDPLEVDRRGAELLGLDWHSVGHLK